jgi:hypothetical protein
MFPVIRRIGKVFRQIALQIHASLASFIGIPRSALKMPTQGIVWGYSIRARASRRDNFLFL